MAKTITPPSIIRVIQNPETWNPTVFESLIRNDLENACGPLCASDELLVALLVMTMDSLVEAHVKIMQDGPTYMYNSGEATSAWQKIRTECLDKIIKLMTELSLVTRSRAKALAVQILKSRMQKISANCFVSLNQSQATQNRPVIQNK